MKLSKVLHRLAEICEENPDMTVERLEKLIEEDESIRQE